MFNLAIRQGVVDQKHYQFRKGRISIKIPQGNKIGFDTKEINSIESLTLEPQNPIWHTRNVLLTSLYFAGMRVSDVLRLRWSNIEDNRLYYT